VYLAAVPRVTDSESHDIKDLCDSFARQSAHAEAFLNSSKAVVAKHPEDKNLFGNGRTHYWCGFQKDGTLKDLAGLMATLETEGMSLYPVRLSYTRPDSTFFVCGDVFHCLRDEKTEYRVWLFDYEVTGHMKPNGPSRGLQLRWDQANSDSGRHCFQVDTSSHNQGLLQFLNQNNKWRRDRSQRLNTAALSQIMRGLSASIANVLASELSKVQSVVAAQRARDRSAEAEPPRSETTLLAWAEQGRETRANATRPDEALAPTDSEAEEPEEPKSTRRKRAEPKKKRSQRKKARTGALTAGAEPAVPPPPPAPAPAGVALLDTHLRDMQTMLADDRVMVVIYKDPNAITK
jgi:hypothetical protein